MNSKVIKEEIFRIKDLMNLNENDSNNFNLLIEASIPVESIERIIDTDAEKALERLRGFSRNTSIPIKDRLRNYLVGLERLPENVKLQKNREVYAIMANSSPKFTEDFVNKYRKTWDDIYDNKIKQHQGNKQKAIDDTVTIIRQSYGNTIANNYLFKLRGAGEREVISNIPKVLKDEDGIKKFQDWMDANHPNWVKKEDGTFGPLERAKGYGNFGRNTEYAWKDYGEEYAQYLKNTEGLAEKIKKANLNKLRPEDLSFMDRFFSSYRTVFNFFRVLVSSWAKERLRLKEGDEEFIDMIFSKMLKANKDNLSNLKAGKSIDLTLYRSIALDVRQLQAEGAGIESLYDQFEKVLKEHMTTPKEKQSAEKIMKLIRENDPFNPNLEYRGSWLRKLMSESTWGIIWRGIWDKKITRLQKFQNIFIRSFSYITFGNMKKISEVRDYFALGKKQGLKMLLIHLYLAKYIGLPIFMTILKFGKYLYNNIFHNPEEKIIYPEWEEAMGNIIIDEYKRMFNQTGMLWSNVLLTITPIHNHYLEIYNTFDELADAVSRGEVDYSSEVDTLIQHAQPIADSIIPGLPPLDTLISRNGVDENRIDSIVSDVENAVRLPQEQPTIPPIVTPKKLTEIEKTQLFKEFCSSQTPPLKFVRRGALGEFITTTSGYTFDEKNNKFIKYY